jgi:hypothetical protein
MMKFLRLELQEEDQWQAGAEVPFFAGVDAESIIQVNQSINNSRIPGSVAIQQVKEGALTYGDVSWHWSWKNINWTEKQESELDLVASQVLIDLDQNCKIRFVPVTESSLQVKMPIRLGFCAPSRNGPRYETQILDVICIAEAHQEECLSNTIISEEGSVLVYNSRVRLVDVLTLSSEPNSPKPQRVPIRFLELIHLDVPLSLVLRGLPDWQEDVYSDDDEQLPYDVGRLFASDYSEDDVSDIDFF